MSTIAAILSPADWETRRSLLSELVRHGPTIAACPIDLWIDAGVGLAARGLRPSDRPLATHGMVHVVFDGRLDARRDLIASLGDAGVVVDESASDAALVARAYGVWGTRFVQHLCGDYSAIVWDQATRRLLAARDRVGIHPLYSVARPGSVIVANDLGRLRQCPGVSSDLSDEAIGDLLLFGGPRRIDGTCFKDVARVPPAHVVEWSSTTDSRASRYWSLDPPATLWHRDPRHYVEQCRDVLQEAVRCRARGSAAVSILMSGGLDSTTVAAVAATVVGADRCQAVTAVYDRLMRDEERRHSTVAAAHLKIGLRHLVADDYDLFDRWDRDAAPPEPISEPLTALSCDLIGLASEHADLALTGYGGDPALLPGAVVRHVGRVPAWRLVRGIAATLARKRWPPLGLKSGARDRWRARHQAAPTWLSASLRRTYDVEGRWQQAYGGSAPALGDALRIEAVRAVDDDTWSRHLEGYHPTATGRPVEVAHPFFDTRVLELALALPSYPWCVDKRVLRDAMAGHLPESILVRPKTPLADDAVAVRGWTPARIVDTIAAAPCLDPYIDRQALRRELESGATWQVHASAMAAASLATWLRLAQHRPEPVSRP